MQCGGGFKVGFHFFVSMSEHVVFQQQNSQIKIKQVVSQCFISWLHSKQNNECDSMPSLCMHFWHLAPQVVACIVAPLHRLHIQFHCWSLISLVAPDLLAKIRRKIPGSKSTSQEIEYVIVTTPCSPAPPQCLTCSECVYIYICNFISVAASAHERSWA